MSDLCTKTEMLKLWRLVTFEPLKVEQSYIPLLKALMYGISASGAQGRDSTLSICHALLKNALLLSEIAKRPTFIFGNCILGRILEQFDHDINRKYFMAIMVINQCIVAL